MLKSGLVSISFRNKSVDELIEAVNKAGLDAIEWGGDVHVPHGNLDVAKAVKEKCLEASIETPSYGSYMRLEDLEGFEGCVESASILDAKTIRVWAGHQNGEDSSDEYFNKIANNAKIALDMAMAKGMTISLEYHKGTLTNQFIYAKRLIELIDNPHIGLYYQPQTDRTHKENLNEMKAIKDMGILTNVHVFHWDKDGRYPLIDGIKDWDNYFKIIRNDNRLRYCMLEFSCDNTLLQFSKDARVLLKSLTQA